ncbi:hypothetical protein Anapl_18069, partial [Anas platyrhynchos]
TATRCTWPSPKSRDNQAVNGTRTSTWRPTRATVHVVRGRICTSMLRVWTTYSPVVARPTQLTLVTLVASQFVPLKAKGAARSAPRMVEKTFWSSSQSCITTAASSK